MKMLDKLTNESDHAAALLRIDELWDAIAGTPEAVERDRLFDLAHEYEEYHHVIPPPDQEEAIAFRRDQSQARSATNT